MIRRAVANDASDIEEMTATASIFAALGDPVRLAMLARLCRDGPLPTISLKHDATVTRQGLTKHLHVLEEAGLVSSDRVGRDRRWSAEARQLSDACAYIDQISRQWDLRIERLKALVEKDGV
jgi:DNA-binding transcriptional ArsR family regulator